MLMMEKKVPRSCVGFLDLGSCPTAERHILYDGVPLSVTCQPTFAVVDGDVAALKYDVIFS
jgi:hypothetical protein